MVFWRKNLGNKSKINMGVGKMVMWVGVIAAGEWDGSAGCAAFGMGSAGEGGRGSGRFLGWCQCADPY